MAVAFRGIQCVAPDRQHVLSNGRFRANTNYSGHIARGIFRDPVRRVGGFDREQTVLIANARR